MSDPIGKRVQLISTSDPYTKLPPGTEGTVMFVDALKTVHVDWDNGSRLGLIPGEDRFMFIEEKS